MATSLETTNSILFLGQTDIIKIWTQSKKSVDFSLTNFTLPLSFKY